MKYEKYLKKSNDKSSVWHYFLRAQDGQSGKCNMCEAIRKCGGGSTTGLSLHLKSAHQIDIKKTAVVNTSCNEPSTSSASPQAPPQIRVLQPIQQNTETSTSSLPLTSDPKKRKITEYFESSNSMETTISRMTALDGIPFSKFCTSKDLRRMFFAAGYNRLPTTPKSIKNIVINYSKKEKKILVEEIKAMKKSGVKFSLTFDEWTSLRNRRYMNVNLHTAIGSEFQHGSLFKNIGLVRVDGTMPAETCIRLLKTKLFEFEVSLDRDIVAITTDGASVMCKVGRNIEAFHQICMAHGIHLGVSDVLYKKASTQEYDENESSDDDEREDEVGDSEIFTFSEVSAPRFNLEYSDVIKKTRSVIKMFLKSPTKNDALQKYVREQESRDLSLVLDCKTRWSSLADMIERFYRLKTCVEKTLIDFNSSVKFTQEEFELLHSIQKSLKIVKITVEALCRREATLLTAEAALKYMLRKLDNQKTSLSKSLAVALRKRISERRQPLTAILQYLHNPEEYFKENEETRRVNHPEFPRMSCDEMITVITELVQRLRLQEHTVQYLQNTSAMSSPVTANASAENETSEDDTGSSASSVIEKELNKAIEHSMTKNQNRSQVGQIGEEEEENMNTIIRIEMTLYENGGTRGKFLDATYKYLLTIPPTSVESERAFSAASYICNKIRSSLNDASLDALCFLRSKFQQTRSACLV